MHIDCAKYRDKNIASSIQIDPNARPFLSDRCGIPRLKMERSRSFKPIFDACYTNTLFFCFGTPTQITSMNTLGVAFKLFYNAIRYRSPSFCNIDVSHRMAVNGTYLLLTSSWNSY